MNIIGWLLTKRTRRRYLEEVNASLAARHAGNKDTGKLHVANDVVVINDKEDMWRIVPKAQADEYMHAAMARERRTANL